MLLEYKNAVLSHAQERLGFVVDKNTKALTSLKSILK